MSNVPGHCWSGSDLSVGDGAFVDVNLCGSINASRALLTTTAQDLAGGKVILYSNYNTIQGIISFFKRANVMRGFALFQLL